MSNTRSQFLKIAGVCSIAAPIFLLGADVFRQTTNREFEWTIGMWLAFVLFVPGVLGLTYHLVSAGSRLAYIGGALAFAGAMAGASMQVLFRVQAVLAEQGAMYTVDQLRQSFKLIASTQMIGLAWPIGLILLAVSLFVIDRGRWLTSLLLTGGAIAFPIGRIAGSASAVVISGILFVAAFGMIGKALIDFDESPR